MCECKWMDIETAPKDSSYVLLAGKHRKDVASGYWLQSAYAGNGAWIWPFVHKYPTHWMPLPAAPQPSTTAQSADSVPAVSDLPPLPAPDLRDVGTKPQEIMEFLKGYATEYARTAIAARAQADSVQEDAARYRWLRDQAHPDSEDSGIAVSESDFNDWGNKFTRYYSGEELDVAIDAAQAAQKDKNENS